ncbi:uncharacterized protein B0P05DRAFT_552207 [Gilbertella persicaria]|uniref:uncharacterized protein n=1 Tax=Gilbertella persicaria TaxID=101096 RepID=UPI00221ED1F8|nr:uncharacterized protein B0P05DRAFT_552207 [Gilbertella persicaria]KAI8068186.1 hypothetical protein B0P05DRAFT_552207 [Gilbertella persicaria]
MATLDTWTPSKRPLDHAPDSPTMEETPMTNSDDLQPTSHLHPSSLGMYATQEPLVIMGSFQKPVTLGRGGACTIKIGRRNRQISRCHVSIEFNKLSSQFELTVLGLNGACVNDIQYDQHATIPLSENSFVDVLGDQFYFRIPAMTQEIKKQKIEHIRELTPEPVELEEQLEKKKQEQPKEEQEEEEEPNREQPKKQEEQQPKEEDYPIELVPVDTLSPIDPKELSPEPEKEDNQVLEEKDLNLQDTTDYAEVIIDALVFSRTSSMPISDICSRILKANPVYAQQPRQVWIERIRKVLKERPFFGEIERKGKTADGSPKENLYYYNSELDPVEWRRATYTQVGRSARKCTLKDKQYFWKIPPKLGRHRSAYIPPSASELKKKKDENTKP